MHLGPLLPCRGPRAFVAPWYTSRFTATVRFSVSKLGDESHDEFSRRVGSGLLEIDGRAITLKSGR